MITMQTSFTKQTGVAVITAVLVLAIAATAATTIAANYQLDMRRTENSLASSQAWSYAKGAEQWTKAILARDAKNSSSYDALDEDWAIELPPFQVPGGYITGKITDAQGKLNLNSLVDSDGKPNLIAKQRVSRLLTLLKINPELVDAIIDWIDTNVEATGSYGAEQDIYRGLEFAYLPADQPMSDISELRLIKGFDQESYNKLLEHVTALPGNTPLNVNTASAEVLACLFITVRPDEALILAEELVVKPAPDGEPYKQASDFHRHQLLQEKNIVLDQDIGVTSNYFNLATKAVIGKSQVKLNSTIHRIGGNKLQVVKRSHKL